MKKLLPFLLLSLTSIAFAQTGQWTWIGGDSVVNQAGVYGTKGVASTGNKPGGRQGASTWTDKNGNLWLFGGLGYAASNELGHLSDLWKYSPVTDEWTWIGGDSVINQAGVYGTKGVASTGNQPGGRVLAAEWTDAAGNFWLFGGGVYAPGTFSPSMNDLWKYNPANNEWTWVSGDTALNIQGVYGTKGLADPANKPGGRSGGVSWIDASGNLWLFGGFGLNSTKTMRVTLNDLWKYDPIGNQWTWVSGDNTGNQPGIYGTKGVENPANKPGGRANAVGWMDTSGNLWIYSGFGRDDDDINGTLNDLWRYNVLSGQWTWMDGSAVIDIEGGRFGAVGWTDATGKFWFFGGEMRIFSGSGGYQKDLRMYDPATNVWTIIRGIDVPTHYGTKGDPDPANWPGERVFASSWVGAEGKLWLFGGFGRPRFDRTGTLNDLWNFTIDAQVPGLRTTITGDTFCAGNKLSVNYTSSHSFNPGNIFTVQLSEANGSFANPINIGSVSATTGGTIEVTIPANIPAGTRYRIRVVASSPVVTGTDNGTDIVINALPVVTITASGGSSSSGLQYKYYEGSWTRLPDFGGLTPVATGNVSNITLAPRKRDEQFAFLFEGKITIPKAGRYYFETASDDGSRLYIGNYGHYITPVVDNDGMHGLQTKGGWYTFPAAGQYDIAVSFFEQGGDQQLAVYWGSEDAGIPMHTPVPAAAFGAAPPLASTLTYKYYEGSWPRLPDFGGLTPVASGTTTNISIAPRKRDDNFAFLWEGKINIPAAGTYYFETRSDDGSKLYIGNYGHYVTPVVDNDGQHAAQFAGGSYTFPAAGVYPIAVSFFEAGGSEGIEIYWTAPQAGIPARTLIPDAAFREEGGEGNDCSAGVTLTASEGDSYRWSTGETTRSITVTQNGSYSVTVTKGGCAATSEPTAINCIDNSITQMGGGKGRMAQGIAASSGLNVKALPNPSPSHFTLQVQSARSGERITLRITDAVGRLVEARTIAANTNVQVGVSYRPGTYVAEVVQGSEKATLKLVKTGAF